MKYLRTSILLCLSYAAVFTSQCGAIESEQNRSTDTSQSKISLDDVLNCIKEIKSTNITSSGQNIVLLGDTGSGKSTLTNLLAKNELEVANNFIQEKHIVLSEPSKSCSKISDRHLKGGTGRLTPIQLENGVTIWDCPGFLILEVFSRNLKMHLTFTN